MKIMHVFYNHELDLSKINLAYIYLISKKTDAQSITQFRPINLINCSIKNITKLLTKKLSKLMDSLISTTQIAYIKGKYIMDNMVCAHKALHTIKKNKIPTVVFKL
jgi:Reverse transcriptase (RNA-dependent DNA polymerase)